MFAFEFLGVQIGCGFVTLLSIRKKIFPSGLCTCLKHREFPIIIVFIPVKLLTPSLNRPKECQTSTVFHVTHAMTTCMSD